MTGAGSATVAYTVESDYGEGPDETDPEWIQPGIDVSVSDLSVQQALERKRHPDDPRPAGSRAGQYEGALSISWSLTDANFHDLVFADGGTALPDGFMQAPSSTWYLAVEMPDGTTEARTPTGAIVQDATINYEQGADISVDLTIAYGDEPSDVTAPTEGSITQPSDEDVYTWHGASFDVDGLGQPLMQSASLSLSALARFRRGQSRHPYDAVVDALEPSFSTDATFTERDQLALAVDDARGDHNNGGDDVGKVPATLTFANGQGDEIEYALSDCQPTSYSWSSLVGAEDLQEPIDYHLTGVDATETTA